MTEGHPFVKVHDALFHEFDQKGNRHMEYVNQRGSYDDFPYEEMRAAFDAVYEAERRQMATDQRDVHACRMLWRSVLERTVDDMRFLRTHVGTRKLKKHEEERLRRIRENPPAEFVDGKWFEQICDYLEVSPERIRRAIWEQETSAA